MEKQPFYSIITVSRNNSATVSDTLYSVHNQQFENYEHIIQDGQSEDGTFSLIRSWAEKDKRVKAFSEPDEGIYHALNKAIFRSRGEYIIFLHADDFFPHTQVLSKIYFFLEKHSFPFLIYGDLHYVDEKNTGKIIRRWKSGTFRRENFLSGWMPPHPALIVKKSVFQTYGFFNPEFRISGDYEWMIRVMFKEHVPALYLDEVLVHMRTGGVSNRSLKHRLLAWKEDRKAWEINEQKRKPYTLIFKKFRKILQYYGK